MVTAPVSVAAASTTAAPYAGAIDVVSVSTATAAGLPGRITRKQMLFGHAQLYEEEERSLVSKL